MNKDEAIMAEVAGGFQSYYRTPKLNKALAEARKAIENPHFDSINPHFKSKFASLKSVLDAVVPILADHGIAFVQELRSAEGGVNCYTHLLHESGEEKTFGPFYIPSTQANAHGTASAATYARRISCMAVSGTVGDVDDDGNAAVDGPASKPITKSQLADLEALIEDVSADKAAFLKYLKIDSLDELPKVSYNNAVAALEKKRGK